MMLLLNQRPLGDAADVADTYRELADCHQCFPIYHTPYLSAQAILRAMGNTIFSRQLSLLLVKVKQFKS